MTIILSTIISVCSIFCFLFLVMTMTPKIEKKSSSIWPHPEMNKDVQNTYYYKLSMSLISTVYDINKQNILMQK